VPLPTRTMRRDGRLIFFFSSLFLPVFPALCKLFFSRWILVFPLSRVFPFGCVFAASFLPSQASFLLFGLFPNLHGQLHQRPHTILLFGLLDFCQIVRPLISNPSLGREHRNRNEHDDDTATEKIGTVRARLVHLRLVSVLRWIRLCLSRIDERRSAAQPFISLAY
jgi:hypothetical protein